MIEQARLLVLKAAYMMDTVGNKVAKKEIAMIKVVAPNVTCKVVDWAIQAYGGAGVHDAFLVGAYASARSLRLADGPDEVHRNAIAKMELREIAGGAATRGSAGATASCAGVDARRTGRSRRPRSRQVQPHANTGSATDTFDYVIVGGGSAGCVLAARLSEDPAVSVCLLEAGRQRSRPADPHAAGHRVLVPRRIHNWAFKTVPQPGWLGRRGYQPRGKTLGGSSSINAMVYARGHRSDYDEWAALGNAGLVLCRRAAVFPPVGAQRAHRRRVSRTGRTAQCRRPALALIVLGALARRRGAAGDEAQRGLQRRGAGRGRALPADAEERRALERRTSLS